MLNKDIMEKFIESWNYLNDLSIVQYKGVSQFGKCLSIDVVKVNPVTLEIDDKEELNTKVQVWLEFGEINYDVYLKKLIPVHDIELDCGADTFEEAIIELANLCKEKGYEVERISEGDINAVEEFIKKYEKKYKKNMNKILN